MLAAAKGSGELSERALPSPLNRIGLVALEGAVLDITGAAALDWREADVWACLGPENRSSDCS